MIKTSGVIGVGRDFWITLYNGYLEKSASNLRDTSDLGLLNVLDSVIKIVLASKYRACHEHGEVSYSRFASLDSMVARYFDRTMRRNLNGCIETARTKI